MRDVWYRYPGARDWTLRSISIEYRPGTMTVLLGPNGSGKTTLMKVSSFIYRPHRGSVYIDERDFWSLEESERLSVRRRVVYVHERPIMIRGSVLDNIVYGLRLRGVDSGEAYRRALEVLRDLEISDIAYRDARETSAGQAQLVSIARALVVDPEIVFLDEPFSHLDRTRRQRLIEILREKRRSGLGLVVSLHEESLIERLAPDNIVVIENGVIADIIERGRQTHEKGL